MYIAIRTHTWYGIVVGHQRYDLKLIVNDDDDDDELRDNGDIRIIYVSCKCFTTFFFDRARAVCV